MIKEQYREQENPCYGCDAYDSEAEGCTMPSTDRSFACPLEAPDQDPESKAAELRGEEYWGGVGDDDADF